MHSSDDPLDNSVEAQFEITQTGLKGTAKLRFISAADRLIGNVVDFVNIPIERVNQRSRESIATEKVIAATARERIRQNDPNTMQLVDTYLRDFARRRANLKAVVLETSEELRRLPATTTHSDSSAEMLDDDWLGNFEMHAERLSSEQMRRLFGRILAGEINQPGTFSRSTLRICSEINQRTAILFAERAKHRVGNCIPYSMDNDKLSDLLDLEEAGLINYGGGSILMVYEAQQDGVFRNAADHYGLMMATKNGERSISIPAVRLTKAGIELSSLIECDELAAFTKLSETVIGQLKEAVIWKIQEIDGKKSFAPGPPAKIILADQGNSTSNQTPF